MSKETSVAPPKPPKGNSHAEYAYAAIRERIVSLALAPRSLIDEEELMSELGVGRTPMREAIKRLAHESFVEIYPRRGTFVSEIQITDLAMISEVRECLEGYAAKLAAERVRDEDLEELDSLLETVRESGAEPVEELMGLDASVHRFIYRTARNEYLEDTLERYFALAARIWNFARNRIPSMDATVAQHEDLLLAIRNRESEEAGRIAADHVDDFERAMRAVL